MPQVRLDDCDGEGKNCQTSIGLYPDIIDEMGRLLNFTWENHKEVDGNWGVMPISGPYNRSGVFGGIIGAIKNGTHMFNTAGWLWIVDRYEIIDFVEVQSSKVMLVTSLKHPEFDLYLFIRPFTNQSWFGKCHIFFIIHITFIYEFILKF